MARAISAECPPRSSPSCGASRRRDTKRPARREASRCWRRWPRSKPAVTTARSCSAPSRSATFPATRRRVNLGAAAWVGHEGEGAKFIWPHTFSRLADEYDRRYGLDARHLSAIAELNFRNAKSNPNAQTRSWVHKPESFTADDVANPVVEGRVRRTDCTQVTDGGAGLVLAGRRTRRALGASAPRRPRRTCPASSAGGIAPSASPTTRSCAARPRDAYVLPHVRQTITRRVRAGRHRGRHGRRRHRDARLLHAVGVHGDRPLRHHPGGQELAGDRGGDARARRPRRR